MIGLVDCNNFYVSCERVFNPKLNRRAVGILSNNDGCIVARSNELKALGVEMGTPAHHVRHLVERGEVILYSSNYELYGDMSHRVQSVLEEETAGVEPYSIDEMFVRMDGFTPEALLAHAKTLRWKVRRYTGIPVCVGVAATHTLAKLANRIAKKHPGYPRRVYPPRRQRRSPALARANRRGRRVGHWPPPERAAAGARHQNRLGSARSGRQTPAAQVLGERRAHGAGAARHPLPGNERPARTQTAHHDQPIVRPPHPAAYRPARGHSPPRPTRR